MNPQQIHSMFHLTLKSSGTFLFSNLWFHPRWNNRYEILVGYHQDDILYTHPIYIAYGKYWPEAQNRKQALEIVKRIQLAFESAGWIVEYKRINSGKENPE